MKNRINWFLYILICATILFAFATFAGGSIKGKVIPADGARQVWAISSTDTLKAAISQGAFEIANVKQGTYKIYIDAIDPYKDIVRDGVQVTQDGTVDLGEIQLTK
jgi:hypothetical protein